MAAQWLSCSLLAFMALSSMALNSSTLVSSREFTALPLRQNRMDAANLAANIGKSRFLPEPVGGLRADNEFLVDLSLGTPRQTISLILDTGSDLVWLPCTSHFTCTDCPRLRHAARLIFRPNLSSSHQNVSCQTSSCRSLVPSLSPHCSGQCNYAYAYGTGNTTGFLQRDTLSLRLQRGATLRIKQFLYGCSTHSEFNPAGLVGFGRGAGSFPSQLGSLIQHRFAYCFVSHAFDNTHTKGSLVFGEAAVLPKGPGVKYTPFVNNPQQHPTFYYVDLEGISIGGKRLNVPKSLFQLQYARGVGGTVFDSGTVLTQLQPTVYQLAIQELKARIRYPRSALLEAAGTFSLCYNLSSIPKAQFPSFVFHFKGADMYLPTENYFFDFTEGYNLPCFAMQNIKHLGDVGPSFIIGNFQQQNFHILYDLEHKRLGFTPRQCSHSL